MLRTFAGFAVSPQHENQYNYHLGSERGSDEVSHYCGSSRLSRAHASCVERPARATTWGWCSLKRSKRNQPSNSGNTELRAACGGVSGRGHLSVACGPGRWLTRLFRRQDECTVLAALLLVVLTIDCSHSAPPARVCTLDACNSGIMVHLSELPSGPFRIEMRPATSEGTSYVFECGSTQPCRQDVFFSSMIADRVFITVVSGRGRRETEIPLVSYSADRPNGPHCDPECQGATVTAQVPK
jgi:hypothetical protein